MLSGANYICTDIVVLPQDDPYTIPCQRLFLEISEDMVHIPLMLEVLFTQDSKIERSVLWCSFRL